MIKDLDDTGIHGYKTQVENDMMLSFDLKNKI